MDTANDIRPKRRVETIVWKFGGSGQLARIFDIHPTTIRHWVKVDSIPAKWQRSLLDLARESGVQLEAEDLIG